MLKLKLGLNPKSEIKSKLPKVNLILNLKSISGNTWADRVGGNDGTVSFPCLYLEVGEVITFDDLSNVLLESSGGDAVVAISGNTLLCSSAGTCYNVVFDNGDSLPLSGHLFSKYSEINAISTTGTFTDQFQSTFNPLEKYNLGIKSTADANTITALFTEDGVDFSYYKYDASAGTSAEVTGTTSTGVDIALDTGDIITGLVIGTKYIDMSVDRNWTIANAENVILPQYIAKVATFPVTFPMTFTTTESGLDVYGSPIVTYLGGNAIAPYSRFTIPALTPDVPDRTNTDYWDVDNLLVDYDATDERSYSPRMFTGGNEYPHSLTTDLYAFAKLRSTDNAIEQLVIYSDAGNEANREKIYRAVKDTVSDPVNYSLNIDADHSFIKNDADAEAEIGDSVKAIHSISSDIEATQVTGASQPLLVENSTGRCWYFDNVNDFLSCGDNFDIGETGVYTFEVKVKTSTGTAALFDKSTESSDNAGYGLFIHPTRPGWYMTSGTTRYIDTDDATVVNDNLWHVISFEIDRNLGTVTRRVDGAISGTVDDISAVGAITNGLPFTICGATYPLDGLIEYVKISITGV